MAISWGNNSNTSDTITYGSSTSLDPLSTNYYSTVTISGIPVGATISDGHGNSFTATSGNTSVNIASWYYTTSSAGGNTYHNFSALTLSGVPSDANFTLTAANSKSPPQTATDAVTVLPAAPTIVSVTDDLTPVTGVLSNGGYTNDTQLVVRVGLTGTGATLGDTVRLYNGASVVSSSNTLTATNILNGYCDITTNTLNNGATYSLVARLTDGPDGSASSSAFIVHEDTSAPTEMLPPGPLIDSLDAGGNIVFTGATSISVGDNISSEILTATISVHSGTFAATTGVAGVTYGNNGTGTVTLTGTASAINAALNNSVYHTTMIDKGSSIDDTLTVSVTDQAGLQSSKSVDIDVTCFMLGTLVRCTTGEVAVELLKVGDLVVTHDGRTAPVRWIGRQTVSTIFANKERVLPIRLKTGSLADNVPSRDLLVSPDHALLVNGALIQAGALVNGTSIVQERNVPAVFTYYHVEVDDHSLILAENTPAETFVDNVDRLGFDNWAEYQALYPEGRSIDELPYPRAKSRRQVPVSTRVMLAARAQEIGAVDTIGVAVA
jgi:hypothetical protein